MWVKDISKKYKDTEDLNAEDERYIFNMMCDNIIQNPRHYLNELDNLYIWEFSIFDYNLDRKVKPKRIY